MVPAAGLKQKKQRFLRLRFLWQCQEIENVYNNKQIPENWVYFNPASLENKVTMTMACVYGMLYILSAYNRLLVLYKINEQVKTNMFVRWPSCSTARPKKYGH